MTRLWQKGKHFKIGFCIGKPQEIPEEEYLVILKIKSRSKYSWIWAIQDFQVYDNFNKKIETSQNKLLIQESPFIRSKKIWKIQSSQLIWLKV